MINRRTTQGVFNPVKRSKYWLRMIGVIGLCLLGLDKVEAACLLSYDQAKALPQGDGLARISFQGGKEGFGSHAEGRLGLPGDRSVHLRIGGCERASLWGWAVEAGLNQNLLNTKDTGLFDLGFRMTMAMMVADYERSSYSEVGIQPSIIMSYPFTVSKGEVERDIRRGMVGLSLGLTTYFIDQKSYRTFENGPNTVKEINLTSDVEWKPLVSVSSSVDILPFLPLSLEVRWQQGGIYGGSSLGYRF